MANQMLFPFARPEPPLVLATPEIAVEQWFAHISDDIILQWPDWRRWFAAADRLESMGLITGEIYYPKPLRLRIRQAMKDW
jgi:hypothetical protein